MWHRGAVHGPKELVREIEFNAAIHLPVELVWGIEGLAASLEDPENELAILAALMSATPGRSLLMQGSVKIDKWYAAHEGEPGIIY